MSEEREPYPHYEAIVIGGGPAGYTALIYLANENINALCVEGFESGGQLIRASRVNNYPGFPTGIEGAQLPQRMRDQAEWLGGQFAFDEVTELDTSSSRFIVRGTMDTWTCDAVILTTGAKPRQLGLESEEALRNKGVGYCAICDGHVFAGKRVAIIGGGDAAVEHATTLTNLDCEVVVIHRRREFRAAKTGQDFLERHSKIETMVPYIVEEMLGVEDQRLRGLLLRNTETGEAREETFDGVFVAIGHDPASDLVAGRVETDDKGFIVTRGRTSHTSIEGVFAGGDLTDPHYRQAVTAASGGCVAALDASRWLADQRSRHLVDSIALSQPR